MKNIFHKTFPLPSLLVPTPFTKGGGGSARPPAISKTVVPMNMKFCRVLETPLKVLEKMLSCLYSVYFVAIATPQRRGVLGENHQISAENTNNSNCYQIHSL